MGKIRGPFDHLTFNATVSFVALAIIAILIVDMVVAGSLAANGGTLVIWIVIACYFIRATYIELKRRDR